MIKKGYFYTVTVMVFFIILLSFFVVVKSDFNSAQQTRVRSMQNFIEDFHRDIDRAAYIAGFRSLLALEEHMMMNGAYLTDAENNFIEAFMNGSVENVHYSVMDNSTFNDYLSAVNVRSRKIGINVFANVTDVSFYQISPWDVVVEYNMFINLTDLRGQAEWQYEQNFETVIPILDFKDPLYVVNTLNKIPNTIIKYQPPEFINDVSDANDTTNLQTFLNNSYYIASTKAPSYLMRLEGNFSASEYGIESLVNLEDFNAQGLTIYSSRSVVDYQYFNDIDADWCDIQNMPTYFKIADDHLYSFEIDPKVDYDGC